MKPETNREKQDDETNDIGYCGIRTLREDDAAGRGFGADGSRCSVGQALPPGVPGLPASGRRAPAHWALADDSYPLPAALVPFVGSGHGRVAARLGVPE